MGTGVFDLGMVVWYHIHSMGHTQARYASGNELAADAVEEAADAKAAPRWGSVDEA